MAIFLRILWCVLGVISVTCGLETTNGDDINHLTMKQLGNLSEFRFDNLKHRLTEKCNTHDLLPLMSTDCKELSIRSQLDDIIRIPDIGSECKKIYQRISVIYNNVLINIKYKYMMALLYIEMRRKFVQVCAPYEQNVKLIRDDWRDCLRAGDECPKQHLIGIIKDMDSFDISDPDFIMWNNRLNAVRPVALSESEMIISLNNEQNEITSNDIVKQSQNKFCIDVSDEISDIIGTIIPQMDFCHYEQEK